MSTEKTETPTYLSQARVADMLGIGRAAVVNYMRRFPDEVPKPAAYLEQPGRERLPLWLPEQMPAWLRFRMKRGGSQMRAMIAALDEQARAEGFDGITELLAATSGATVEAPQGDGSAK